MQTESTTSDLLFTEDYYVRAETGKRLANYIIDLIVFYALFFIVGIVLAIFSPAAIDNLSYGSDSGFALVDRLFTLILYAVYMSVLEGLFKGKSLGKLITGTRAVNLDGSRISWGKAFERGFSRAVPFCVFSAFGTPCNPWQDKWTNTMVIDERKSAIRQDYTTENQQAI